MEKWAGRSADRHGHMDKFAGHLGRWACALTVQVSERITMVDWITREGLCQFYGWVMSEGGLVWRIAPGVHPEIWFSGQSGGRLSAVHDNSGSSRDCVPRELCPSKIR